VPGDLWLFRGPKLRQAFRFCVVGGVATVVHVAIAYVLVVSAGVAPPLANGVAFCVATVFSYFVNTLWSFGKRLHGRTLFRFCVVASVGAAISVGLSGLLDHHGVHFLLGILAVVCVVPFVTFTLHSLWTYR